MNDARFMNCALDEARKSLQAGGIPIGAVLVRGNTIIGKGHNQRVQLSDAIAHGEMDCIRNAGRQRTYRDTVLFTTLSPCMMCSGAVVQFGIPRVVIGDNSTFCGNEDFLRSRGVEVVILNDVRCHEVMQKFIERHPEIWKEDIGEGQDS